MYFLSYDIKLYEHWIIFLTSKWLIILTYGLNMCRSTSMQPHRSSHNARNWARFYVKHPFPWHFWCSKNRIYGKKCSSHRCHFSSSNSCWSFYCFGHAWHYSILVIYGDTMTMPGEEIASCRLKMICFVYHPVFFLC